MTRTIKSKIEFEFDVELANEGLDTPMTDDELIEYATRTFAEDVYSMSLHNELQSAIRTTIVEG
jgi:hypothetical protein